jgi:hypothetical protein
MMTEAIATPSIAITIVRQQGKAIDITTNSPWVAHFLTVLKVSRSYHT